MASRSNLVCYNVESINLWVGLGWVATKYGMLVTVPVVTTEDFMTGLVTVPVVTYYTA